MAERKFYAYVDTWDRPIARFRLHTWLDLKRRIPMYGVQVKQPGTKHFAHVIKEDGQPVLFDNQEQAHAYAQAFTQQRPEVQHGKA